MRNNVHVNIRIYNRPTVAANGRLHSPSSAAPAVSIVTVPMAMTLFSYRYGIVTGGPANNSIQ